MFVVGQELLLTSVVGQELLLTSVVDPVLSRAAMPLESLLQPGVRLGKLLLLISVMS
jgi:hypothetical protein